MKTYLDFLQVSFAHFAEQILHFEKTVKEQRLSLTLAYHTQLKVYTPDQSGPPLADSAVCNTHASFLLQQFGTVIHWQNYVP